MPVFEYNQEENQKGKEMKTIKGISGMVIWTALVALFLYAVDAHNKYQHLGIAILIGLALLVTHIVNMVIYFKVAGKEPYKWFKDGDF